ncbi:MAG TPA: roadblock/LC7 domain-containing protein [Methylomirabilota bacterium]|nr:roadblock/LC7 domain-containing protein [Methylomirabilota bacterium]
MTALPQLIEEDIQQMDSVLRELLVRGELKLVVLADKAGFRLAAQGECEGVDVTTLSALASNTFNATQAIAGMLEEPQFNSIYQQGQKYNLLVQSVDENTVLIIVFGADVNVGLVKYYVGPASQALARQLLTARDRAPGEGLDLAMLNVSSADEFFKRKGA